MLAVTAGPVAKSSVAPVFRGPAVAFHHCRRGVFAPGHPGELSQQIPFELVDAVLAETGTVQLWFRDLPSHVGLHFVLALGLYGHLGCARVLHKLVADQRVR